MKEPKFPLKTRTVTIEVTDWEQYWILDYKGDLETEKVTGYIFDKEDYPSLEHAQDAFKLWVHEKKQQREQGAAEAKAKRSQQRAEKKQRSQEYAKEHLAKKGAGDNASVDQ